MPFDQSQRILDWIRGWDWDPRTIKRVHSFVYDIQVHMQNYCIERNYIFPSHSGNGCQCQRDDLTSWGKLLDSGDPA